MAGPSGFWKVVATVLCAADLIKLVRLASAIKMDASLRYSVTTSAGVAGSHAAIFGSRAFNQHYRYDRAEGDGEGHKRKFSWLMSWMRERGMPADDVKRRIGDVIVKTLLPAQSDVLHKYTSLYPRRDAPGDSACFEVLGFDVMIDADLKPWIIEVRAAGCTSLCVCVCGGGGFVHY